MPEPSFWQPDLVALYFPKLTELTDTQVAAARARLESYLRAGWPEVDMRPNSPLGDLMLTPFAYLLAAMETAGGRFMSDLDLEQVAQGKIYNCDFVRAFLANFGVYDQASLQSTGVVRLVFATDADYTVDRRMRFQFGSNTFDLRLDFPGHLQIYKVGSVPTLNTNARVLRDIGNGQYACDVYVKGDMGAAVVAGDTATVDLVLTQLVSATALTDFATGEPASSLSVLAQKTRERFSGANLCARNNAVSYLQREFPELLGVSASVPGDAVQLRAAVNALGINEPKVDVYARSSQYDFLTAQQVRIQFFEEQDAVSVQRFIAKLAVVGNPLFIKSITSVDNPAVVLYPDNGLEIFTRSRSAAKAPLLTCAGTDYEDLWVSFEMPKNSSTGTDLLTTATDSDGSRFADFVVEYYYDPLFPAISSRVNSADVKPAGVDMLARPFVPVVITQFEVNYVKRAGTTMLLDQAKAEILAYLRKTTYPDAFSSAQIGDSMYYAGAADMKSIRVQARVWWSAATLVLPADAADPLVDYASAKGDAVTPPTVLIGNSSELALESYIDPLIGTGDETFAAVDILNLCYLLDPAVITFSETVR